MDTIRQVYREWAAAKEIKVWEEVNRSIFNHRLARVPLLPSAADKEFRPPEGKKRGTTYSRSQYVAYGMLRANAPGP